MILSTNQELRLHIPSHAIDDVTLLSGIIDNSEKDFLRDKLGIPLYDRLCAYYESIDPITFVNNVTNGTYTDDPWAELLLNAQRMVCNDALARFAYQQVISINGSGVNVVSGNDYGNADDRLLDKGVGGYKKEALVSLNNLLTILEEWAKAPVSNASASEETSEQQSSDAPSTDGVPTPSSAIADIISLWQQSRYYYLHASLLIPSCSTLQPFFNVYENRDKFIQMLPDLHYIQEELVAPTIGEDFTEALAALSLKGTDSKPLARIIRTLRSAIAAELESRTKVITTDNERKIPVAASHSEATWTAENADYTESDPSFTQKTIDAYKLTDLVKVSIELLQDSMFDLESYIGHEYAYAFGAAEEESFCVGTGSGQPTGLFTANGGEVGVTAASSTAVTADEIISLESCTSNKSTVDVRLCEKLFCI